MGILLSVIAIFLGAVAIMTMMDLGAARFNTWIRRRAVKAYSRDLTAGKKTDARFCLFLRSSEFDLETSERFSWQTPKIHDRPILSSESSLSFRPHLSSAIQPIIIKTAKNAESLVETAAINYPEQQWQEAILSDMAAAAFIIVAPHWPSQSLHWEIEKIIENGFLSKTFILTPDLGCFGACPRGEIDRSYWRREAMAEVPIAVFKQEYGRFGYQDAYERAIESTSDRLAREHECKQGWSQAQKLFHSVGVVLSDPNSSGQFFRVDDLSLIAEPVCDWMSVSGWKLDQIANPNRRRRASERTSYHRRHQ